MKFEDFANQFENIAQWFFLILSVICIAVVTPLSYTSERKINQESVKPDFDFKLYEFPNYTIANTINIINSAKKSIDISFETPFNFSFSPFLESFQKSLLDASKRSVSIRLCTQDEKYRPPSDSISISYFPKSAKTHFKVNLMIIDKEIIYMPSSVLFATDEPIITYFATIKSASLMYDAQAAFNYVYNMPKVGYYFVSKKEYSYDRQYTESMSLMWNNCGKFFTNRTSFDKEIIAALDYSAEDKYLISSRFFPKGPITKLKEREITAFHTAIIEARNTNDITYTIVSSCEDLERNQLLYKSILASHKSEKTKIHYFNRGTKEVDGTIISTSDVLVLSPISYAESFRRNELSLGLVYNNTIIYDYVKNALQNLVHYKSSTEVRC